MPVIKKMPRALVAGCAGFIGSHLVESLLEKNILVTGVDNLSTGKKIYLEKSLKNSNFNFVENDLNNGISKDIENVKYDYVFHLASSESHTKDNNDDIEYQILLTNSIGTKNLLEFASKNNSKFVLVSSLEIYQGFVSSISLENYFGSSEEEERAFSYSEAKRFAEALVWQFYKKNDLDVRIIRLSEVYGPRMSLKSSASLGVSLDYFLHDQDLVVSGDGLSKERYAYISDAINLIETSVFNEVGRGLILPLVPNLTTPLEIAYLLKDMSAGKLDILFRPAKKVEVIPSVEKIDTSSLKKIGFEIKVSFKDGIAQTVKWFGKGMESESIINSQMVLKTIEKPIVKDKKKFVIKINKNVKKLLLIIFLTLTLTGLFVGGYEIISKIFLTPPKNDISQYLESYSNGRYKEIIDSIDGAKSGFSDGMFGDQATSQDQFSQNYLVDYLKYISESKYELTQIYTNIFSEQDNKSELIRVSSTIAKIEAANRYLLLYKSSIADKTAQLNIDKEQQININLLKLANNTAELFSGEKRYLIITTDSSKSEYFLGQPLKQYLLRVNDYNFVDVTETEIIVEDGQDIDFAEYATKYVKEAKIKLGGDISGVLFIDSKVLQNTTPFQFALSVVKENKVSVDNLLKAIKERRLIFFSTLSDVNIAGDFGITPVLAFSDSADFIVLNMDNTGGTDSASYLITNSVYSLIENKDNYLASLTLTVLHTGKDNDIKQGMFSGNIKLLFPANATLFDVRSDGSLWKKNIEYQLSKNKYDTNLISFPTIINPGKSITVTITYRLTKPALSGYNLMIPKIGNVKTQNFTFKFRPLDPSRFSLQDFQNEGGVYKYTKTLDSNLTIKL